jgi:hypothetical protein
VVNIPGFPFGPRFDFSSASASSGVLVGSSITLTFLDQTLLDKCVEIWIQPPVMDFFFVVVFEFVFDREPVWVLKPRNYIQAGR